MGIADVGTIKLPMGFQDRETSYNTLYVNGREQPLSRWPDTGYARTGRIIQGSASIPGIFEYPDHVGDRWVNATDAFIEGYFSAEYAYERKGAKVDATNKTITTDTRTSYGISTNKRWSILNLLEEIDSPGEWYIDKAKKVLYYYPPYTLANVTIELTTLKEPMIVFNNARHVKIEGLEFQNTCDDAVPDCPAT